MTITADARFARCLDFVLTFEGGFVDDSHDPGGATNMGITLVTLSDHLDRTATVDDVKNLSRATAADIYRKEFWGPSDHLGPGVDLMYFNAAVNNGPGHAARFLQHGCGAVQDGVVGPSTVASANAMHPGILIANFATAQMGYYMGLPGYPRYGTGWLNRLKTASRTATNWANAS